MARSEEAGPALEEAGGSTVGEKKKNLASSGKTWPTKLKQPQSYDRKNTVKDIGMLLTERTRAAIRATTYQEMDLGAGAIPYVGALTNPLSDIGDANLNNLYDKENEPEDGSESDTSDIKTTMSLDDTSRKILDTYYGTHTEVTKVDRSSPGIAMGEAQVLNPDFQFNELDDIRSDIRRPYIGRMYSEQIYDYNLPKMLIDVGTVTIKLPTLAILHSIFLGDKTSGRISSYLRDPGNNPIKWAFQSIGGAISSVMSFIAGGVLSLKKMYRFKSQTKVYLRYVNELLLEMASWMNLASVPEDISTENENKDIWSILKGFISDDVEDKNSPINKAYSKLTDPDRMKSGSNVEVYSSIWNFPVSGSYMGKYGRLSALICLPDLGRTGTDITKKFVKMPSNPETEDDDFWKNTLQLAFSSYIPFALEKGVTVSESFSNSLMEHPVMTNINQQGMENQNEAMTQMVLGSGFGRAGAGAVKTIKSIGTKDFLPSLAGVAKDIGSEFLKWGVRKIISGEGGELGMVAAGNGRLILPEVWQDSSFDRSYNVSINLHARYGHRLSIFENIMVPLAFLYPMVIPRQMGITIYTNPFYIRTFCKGLFSCELGMVSNMTINRGNDRNDRTQEGFSRNVEVSLNIKDVLPRITLGLDGGVWSLINIQNSAMREYLTMICNVDLVDRLSMVDNFEHKWNKFKMKYSKHNFFDGFRFLLGNNPISKIVTTPGSLFFASDLAERTRSNIRVPKVF